MFGGLPSPGVEEVWVGPLPPRVPPVSDSVDPGVRVVSMKGLGPGSPKSTSTFGKNLASCSTP